MVVNYPHHYVYFNVFAGKNWDELWERDYWKLSVKQLFTNLVEKDCMQETCKLLVSDLDKAVWVLPVDIQKKIAIVPQMSADYIVGDYRNISGDYPQNYFMGFKEYISIKVDGRKVMTIFKKVSLDDL